MSTSGAPSAVDFGAPERASTSLSPTGLDTPGQARHTTARSPVDYGHLERRGSTLSRTTTGSSFEGGGRQRRPTRSNTVTAYNEHADNLSAYQQPGAEPGIDVTAAKETLPADLVNLKAQCQIKITDYSDVEIQHIEASNSTLQAALDEPRPEGLPCRWISVNGLSWDVIETLGKKYPLHRLAIEDLIHLHTRTKVDWYADQAFVVITLQKLVKLHYHSNRNDGPCDCDAASSSDEDEVKDEKPGRGRSGSNGSSTWSSWWKHKPRKDTTVLPQHLDRNRDGKIDEFVQAHSGLSENAPIKPIRTLHRYESAQIPEHTAFMEKHGVLADEDLAVSVEQVSMFLLADNTIVSFFEHSAEDIERPLLERLSSTETMLRRSADASLMLQALIDAIVDLVVPVRDAYNKARKELQVDAMTNPNVKTSRALHIFGEEIDMLQNLFKPIVHLVNALRDHQNEVPLPTMATTPTLSSPPPAPPAPEHASTLTPDPQRSDTSLKSKRDRQGAPAYNRKISGFRRTDLRRAATATSVSITPLAHTYFGDVLDHCITMIQSFEQMDASASNISTLIFNTVGAKTNNFMMILAVVTVLFAPLTFITGYFGMNFSSGSGLKHPFAFFWVVAIPGLVGFSSIVFATMLWDNIADFLAKRGIKAHRKVRDRRRRTALGL